MTDLAEVLAEPRTHATSADRYHDYCLEPYRPRRPLCDRSRRSEAFLWASLAHAGLRAELEPLLEALRAAVGRDHTVWGIKWADGRLWWELYFYDPRWERPQSHLPALAETLAPWLAIEPTLPGHVRPMMVSFDLDGSTLERGTIDEVNLYLTGTPEHAGRSYVRTTDRFELRNTYRFLDPKREIEILLPLLEASVFVDLSTEPKLARALLPRFFPCKRICVAKKQDRDAIYYSGLGVEPLADFLERFEYPAPLRALATEHAAAFEHLSFDIGLDLRDEAGELTYPKTSFYGTL